jgi:hypothetical protein
MPFDKDKWVECGQYDTRVLYVEGNTRYRMALWLEKNYNFCDKSLSEIWEKFEPFLKQDSLAALEIAQKHKKITIVTKQYNPNFLIGIDPWFDTDWIEIFFDENYMVSKVYYVHYNRKTKHQTERKICGSGNMKRKIEN